MGLVIDSIAATGVQTFAYLVRRGGAVGTPTVDEMDPAIRGLLVWRLQDVNPLVGEHGLQSVISVVLTPFAVLVDVHVDDKDTILRPGREPYVAAAPRPAFAEPSGHDHRILTGRTIVYPGVTGREDFAILAKRDHIIARICVHQSSSRQPVGVVINFLEGVYCVEIQGYRHHFSSPHLAAHQSLPTPSKSRMSGTRRRGDSMASFILL